MTEKVLPCFGTCRTINDMFEKGCDFCANFKACRKQVRQHEEAKRELARSAVKRPHSGHPWPPRRRN